ncbi:MAG: hypothetical protein JXR47_07710 [Thiotrichales bacterium]|nr:hypothetical protein [Thiotrichales bacterium]
MNHYLKKDWKTFRNEVIELDGGQCVRCQKTAEEGAVLQVHHKRYIRGKFPWEYPFELCETLCKGCHAAEHGKIPPKTGWEYAGSDDLGDLIGTCEYCGSPLRYIFYISHEKWPTLEVGTVCCDNLTGTETASTQRRQKDREINFLNSSRWKVTQTKDQNDQNINSFKIKLKGNNICITQISFGKFQLTINNTEGKVYSSLNKAKIKAFHFIDSGDAEKYFNQ